MTATDDNHPWIPGWLPGLPVIGRTLVVLLNDRRARYLVAGGVTAAVFYGLFAIGWLLFGHWAGYLVVMTVANFLTAVVTYPLYRVGVHQAAASGLLGFGRYYLTCLWALVFGLGGMPLLVEVLHLPVLVAQAIVIVIWPLINYQIQKHWVFKRD